MEIKFEELAKGDIELMKKEIQWHKESKNSKWLYIGIGIVLSIIIVAMIMYSIAEKTGGLDPKLIISILTIFGALLAFGLRMMKRADRIGEPSNRIFDDYFYSKGYTIIFEDTEIKILNAGERVIKWRHVKEIVDLDSFIMIQQKSGEPVVIHKDKHSHQGIDLLKTVNQYFYRHMQYEV